MHLDLPEFANISFKLEGILTTREGFVKNPLQGASDFNSFDKRGIHTEALWKPSPDFSADLSFDKSYDATTTLYQQLVSAGAGLPATATNPASTNPALAAYARFAAAGIPNVLAALNTLQPRRVDTALVGSPEQPSVGRTTGYRLGLEYKAAANLTLKSITAFREMTQSQFDNGSVVPSLQIPVSAGNPTGLFNLSTPTTGNFVNGVNAGPVPAFDGGVPGTAFSRYSFASFRQNQFSEELQVIGEFNRLKYQLGGLYYQERVQDNAQAFNTEELIGATGTSVVYPSPSTAAQVIQRASYVKTTSVGLYGQATYTPPIGDDIVHVTGGLRYTNDKKRGFLFTVNGAAPIVPVNGVNVQAPVPLVYSKSRVDPLINVAIDLSKCLTRN